MTTYVKLPKNLISIRYPGYFWDIEEKVLYSLKSGLLKKMTMYRPNWHNKQREDFYKISHLGIRTHLTMSYLNSIKPKKSRIGFYKNDQ